MKESLCIFHRCVTLIYLEYPESVTGGGFLSYIYDILPSASEIPTRRKYLYTLESYII